MGTSLLRPIARLEPPSAVTKRISSVAYAVDDSASDEKTASAIVFGSRCSSMAVVANGRPTKIRLNVSSIPDRPQLGAHSMSLSAQARNECVRKRSRIRRIPVAGRRLRGDRGEVGGRRERERAAQLVGERDRDDALVDRHRDVGVADEDETRDLPPALDNR